jgi:hypothetical protein
VSENLQIVIGIILLICVYILSRIVVVRKLRSAARKILRDLERQDARAPGSAASLPYAKKSIFNIGLRDYKPKALESLVNSGVVGMTADGKYYLKASNGDLG